MVARSRETKIVDKIKDALTKIEGAYSLIIMTNKKLIGIKDPFGIRPLVWGRKNGGYVLAIRETCALDIIGAQYVRDVENGEMVVITDTGLESIRLSTEYKPRPCIFEQIYFARPDSIVNGQTVYTYRINLGQYLAAEYDIDADVIVPIPDSGVPAAIGYSQQSGVPFELGIIQIITLAVHLSSHLNPFVNLVLN